MEKICLMYHDVYISHASESGLASDLYKLDVIQFEKQLKILQELKRQNIEAVLTFDDGGSSFYCPIADLLDKYGFKGIFFIATSYVNTPGFVTDSQLQEMEQRGHVIGSHSHSHPENLASLTKEQIAKEWLDSVNVLASILGHEVKIASVPNGYMSKNVISGAKEAGIEELYTSEPSTSTKKVTGIMTHGRFVVLNNTTQEDLRNICTNDFYRKKMLLRSKVLSIPKYILGNKYETVKNLLLNQNESN